MVILNFSATEAFFKENSGYFLKAAVSHATFDSHLKAVLTRFSI